MYKMIHIFFRRRKIVGLRGSIRGYSILKRRRKIGVLRDIKSRLVDCTLDQLGAQGSKFIFGKSVSQSELVIRQMLLQRHGGSALIKKILESIGNPSCAIVYPMPKEWRTLLKSQGVNVNEIKSRVAWAILVFLYFGWGVLNIIYLAATSAMRTLRRTSYKNRCYVYFNGLTVANLPVSGGVRSCDICSWYIHWRGHLAGLEAVRHSVFGANAATIDGCTVEYAAEPFYIFRGIRNILHFIIWGGFSIIVAAMDGLRGRWWNALALSEASRAKCVQLCDTNELAREYLFHYSGTIYRPMWTYEAEAKGAKIICYFYSTSEQVKLPSGYVSQQYEWGAASWPNYLVWDFYQESLIRRDIDSNANIQIVGPIWFGDSNIEVPKINDITIGVFDIQPHQQASYFGFNTNCDYHTVEYPRMQIQFLEDIHLVLRECGVIMAFKKKREIGKRGVKKYLKLLEKLSLSPNVVLIPPSISPIRIIEKCFATISMPFTSTAHYNFGSSNLRAYYDPTGWIQKDDRGAHGVQILSGIEELRCWVKAIVAKFSNDLQGDLDRSGFVEQSKNGRV